VALTHSGVYHSQGQAERVAFVGCMAVAPRGRVRQKRGMHMQQEPWIAVAQVGDNLCAWVHEGGQVTALRTVPVQPFVPALLELIGAYLRDDGVMPVMYALADAGHVRVPAPPPLDACVLPSVDPRIALSGLSSLYQTQPVDLLGMQGVQVAGFVAANPDWDGVLCLTGAQSKWVHISAGEVVSFQTYLTGEMFDLLAEHSVLRDAIGRATEGAGQDDESFHTALSDALSRPERVAGALFGLHAEAGLGPVTARARLAGMLIGMELAGARPYWLGRDIALIGEAEWTAHYAAALRSQGVPVHYYDAAEMALRGLQQAYAAHSIP